MSTPRSSLALVVMLTFVLVLAWRSPLLYPLRILVVLFHELGHGLAAVLTGGEFLQISLDHREGGLAITRGGSRFIILNAGYLGSLVAGLGVLYLSRVPRSARPLAVTMALVVTAATLLYVRPVVSFGFGYGLAAGVGLALVGARAPHMITWWLMRIIGTFSVLYALVDIRDDVLRGRGAVSDATMLAELTGLPAPLWGFGWLMVGACALWVFRQKLY